MTQWYYSDYDRNRHGPVSARDLAELHANGQLSPDTLVWREGLAQWQPWSTMVGEVSNSRRLSLIACFFFCCSAPSGIMPAQITSIAAVASPSRPTAAIAPRQPIDGSRATVMIGPAIRPTMPVSVCTE